MARLLFAAVFGVLASQANAAPLDDASYLKGHYIADVGELEKVSCPVGGRYDCLAFPSNLYKLNGQCLQIPSYYGEGSRNTTFLAVDVSTKRPSAFVVEGILAVCASTPFFSTTVPFSFRASPSSALPSEPTAVQFTLEGVKFLRGDRVARRRA